MFRRIKEYAKFLRSLIITNIKLLRGMWRLTKVPHPAITIFGGSKLSLNFIYAKKAFEVGRRLTEKGFSIITGGGPGIMEAANKGAYEVAKKYGVKNHGKLRFTSFGISLTSFSKEGINPYVQDKIFMKHFFARKWLLVRYSVGFIVFPGGFGTLDELFEIVTLEQNFKMPLFPIVLIDRGYWEPIIQWMYKKALDNNFITKKDLTIIKITDSVEDAISIIVKHCKKFIKTKRPYMPNDFKNE